MAYTLEEKKEIQYKILEHMVEGNSAVRDAIKAVGISTSTFFRWLDDDSDFAKQYTRACEIRTEMLFDEILDIADDSSMDFKENEEGVPVFDREHVQRSKLRIDARQWHITKTMPKKYGNKIDVTTEGEKMNANPIQVTLGVIDAEKNKK